MLQGEMGAHFQQIFDWGMLLLAAKNILQKIL